MSADFETLKAVLLSLGGQHVSDHDLDDLSGIVRHGGHVEYRNVEVWLGHAGECHKNSLERVKQLPDLALWTGFALMPDDVWVRHSWLMDGGGTLVETTVEGAVYFGHVLDGLELLLFADRLNGPSAELLAMFDRLGGDGG
jgi:hypothetical protein